jgi:hypothetical protein
MVETNTATIDTVKTASPAIIDSLGRYMVQTNPETVYVYNKIIKHDTLLTVKYYPKYKTVYLKAVPESVTVYKVIPQTKIEKEVEKVPFIQKVGFISIGLLIGIFLIGVLIVLVRIKVI